MRAAVLSDGESRTIEALRAIDRRPAKRAARVFAERGFPSRRIEQWRWSDLRQALAEVETVHATPGDAGQVHQYQPVDDTGDPIEMLAGALGGALSFEAPTGAETANFVFDDFGVRALKVYGNTVLIERLGRTGALAASSLRAAVVGDLTRIVIHVGGEDDVALSTAHIDVTGRFRQFIVSTGAKLARFETHVDVKGEGAEVELNGIYLAGPNRHADLTSVIHHNVPNGTTRQLIKGVVRKGGRGVFQGKIVVAHGAQKTDARQYHHGLLLEEGAEVFAKPELMIHADDVQCAHGNTAGGLDETALFYLRSRGVPEKQARALLIEAFLVEAIPAGLPVEITDELVGIIRAWLDRGAA